MFNNLQDFFDSLTGQIVTIAVILVLFLAVILLSGRNKKDSKTATTAMVMSALFVALAAVLKQIPLFALPQGGSVSPLSMLPIVLCAYFFGTRQAVLAGMCVGMLDLIFKPYVIHPLQLLLDYPLAFGAIGFAGLVFLWKKDAIIPAFIVGAFGRYVMAVLSGAIFFGSYAPANFNGVTWSLWYNLGYIGVEAAITVAVLAIPQVRHTFSRLKGQLQ